VQGVTQCCYAPITLATLTLSPADAAALKALYEQNLSKGRAFVPGATGVGPLEACVLVVEHAGRRIELEAEAVFVKEEGLGAGVGLQLKGFDAETIAALAAFVAGPRDDPPPITEPAEPADEEHARVPGANALQDRIRAMSAAEQQKLAMNGGMQERIVLERTFGGNVWEGLLSNPRITIPEVAKIARKGTLPRPLVENIAGHASWLAAAEVQRALLGNPRTSTAIASKILSMMSRADLILVPQQTAYPQSIRQMARKLLQK
jgi:hypothetical protein